MKSDRGRGLYHKEPLRCDLSDGLSEIQQFKIIIDHFRVSYSCLRRSTRVKPKPKEVSHESSLRRQDLGGLSPVT